MLRPSVAGAALALVLAMPIAVSAKTKALPADHGSIAAATRGMHKTDGLLPLYWDASAGKLYLEVPRPGEQLIYMTTLTQGLGSNDVGLDRGQIGENGGSGKIVSFEHVGDKLLLEQHNTAFRADSDNPAEQLAVRQSFAQSVLWGFKVVASDGEAVLVDATPFALHDAHGAIAALKKTKQGKFTLDPARSAVYPDGTKAFPRNTEIEATLTLSGDDPGQYVEDVTPTPEAVTIRERQSFIALPPPGYTPRRGDPRAGYFEIDYADYAAPMGEPLMQHLIIRHRLRKKDPTAAVSDAVEPIVYYVDRGAPPLIRQALIEGASWWNQAFEAAGYRNAFRVEPLPEGADPMDVRYNIIQWVHRATRGWSYGAAVVDPRTGEIIKGNVSLGSLRARYDYLIAEGLLSPYGTPGDVPPDMQKLVLARLRQLAAHELGHTLGLAHNYLASAENRASVMDYPQPLIKLAADGSLDLSDAYAVGIGAWDKVAIDYGYQDFAPGTDEHAALNRIIDDARAKGLVFLTDQDARPPGAAEPNTSLWDNGTDSAAELRRMLAVRHAALQRFGENAIRRGEPLATIEDALVPLYLFHRYQIDATAKTLGGQYYRYALRGDGQQPLRAVPAEVQQRALSALLETLSPQVLELPASLLQMLPPRPFTYPKTRELFASWTSPSFDALTPPATAAELTISMILQPERDARLVEQHLLDAGLPDFAAVVDQLVAATFDGKSDNAYQAAILRGEQGIVVDHLLDLATGAPMPQVRAVALLKLDALQARLHKSGGDEAEQAHRLLLADEIQHYREHPELWKQHAPAPDVPPGSPLGGADDDAGW